MKTFTTDEYRKSITDSILDGSADEQTDNQGQIVIYTGMFEWTDGTIHDEPDPTWNDE